MNETLFSIFRNDNLEATENLSKAFESSWKSPSNIALVKYWGKKGQQLPANPSLSLTLTEAYTETSVKAIPADMKSGIKTLNKDPNHPFIPKLQTLLNWVSAEIHELSAFAFEIETRNTFPHSAGIASSASGISAFALCLLDIAYSVLNMPVDNDKFRQLASFAARIGSGSACRSVVPGYSLWGETGLVSGSSDYFAVEINSSVHPYFTGLCDAILMVSSEPKSLASTAGHSQMNIHPYSKARIAQANQNIQNVLSALQQGDIEKLSGIVENEALSLHALIMSAETGTILMAPGTIELIHQIRKARQSGLPLFFTLDAGPNVHLLYPASHSVEAGKYINENLAPLCEKNRVIFDHGGKGPERLFSGVLNLC